MMVTLTKVSIVTSVAGSRFTVGRTIYVKLCHVLAKVLQSIHRLKIYLDSYLAEKISVYFCLFVSSYLLYSSALARL